MLLVQHAQGIVLSRAFEDRFDFQKDDLVGFLDEHVQLLRLLRLGIQLHQDRINDLASLIRKDPFGKVKAAHHHRRVQRLLS